MYENGCHKNTESCKMSPWQTVLAIVDLPEGPRTDLSRCPTVITVTNAIFTTAVVLLTGSSSASLLSITAYDNYQQMWVKSKRGTYISVNHNAKWMKPIYSPDPVWSVVPSDGEFSLAWAARNKVLISGTSVGRASGTSKLRPGLLDGNTEQTFYLNPKKAHIFTYMGLGISASPRVVNQGSMSHEIKFKHIQKGSLALFCQQRS